MKQNEIQLLSTIKNKINPEQDETFLQQLVESNLELVKTNIYLVRQLEELTRREQIRT